MILQMHNISTLLYKYTNDLVAVLTDILVYEFTLMNLSGVLNKHVNSN